MTEVARSPSVTASKHSAMDTAGEMAGRDSFLNAARGPQHRISESAAAAAAVSRNSEEERFSPPEEEKNDVDRKPAAVILDGHAALVMEGSRPGNPDPDISAEEVKVPPPVPGLVMPEAIRISPVPPKPAASRAAAAAVPPVQVVRPLPLKTDEAVGLAFVPVPAQTGGARPPLPVAQEQESRETDQRDNDEVLRQAAEQRRINDEARRRREAQVEFPNSPATERAEQRPPVQQMDGEGQPPPTRHVQYDSAQPERRGGHGHQHRRSQGRSHSGVSSGAGSFGRRPTRRHSGSSGMADSGDEHPHTAPLTPLFQRIVTDDVQLTQKLSRLIEKQNTKVKQLEEQHRIMQESLHREIERRAELEKTLADHEKEWTERCVQLEKERDDWEQAVAEEQKKNKDLQAVIARKELDIQRILQQKKNEMQSVRHIRGGPLSMTERPSQSPLTGSNSKSSSPSAPGQRKPHYKSPQHYLSGSGSVEEVRARNVSNSLSEFFGM